MPSKLLIDSMNRVRNLQLDSMSRAVEIASPRKKTKKTMLWRVRWQLEVRGKTKTRDAYYIDEQAAKRFGDELWKDKDTISVEIESGFNSKGEKE